MIGVFIVLYECLFQIQDGNYDFSKVATYDSIQFFIFIDTFLYLGVAILLFETGPTILPIRDSMLNKDVLDIFNHFLRNFIKSQIYLY